MSMISCLQWVRRGVAAEHPVKVVLEPADLAACVNAAAAKKKTKQPLDDQQDRADDGSGESDDEQSDDVTEEDEEEDGEEIVAGNVLDLTTYDEEADAVDAQFAGLEGLVRFADNSEDPYITSQADIDNDSDLDDFTLRPTDNLVVVGQVEVDEARVEVYVWEEEDKNCYIHHDILIGQAPLCLQWTDYDRTEPNTAGNFIAVGSVHPAIEIWPLDVVDSMEPIAVLGPSDLQLKPGSVLGEEPARKKRKNAKKAPVQTDTKSTGHTDAVLGLSWNTENRHILASCSADSTVKLWDLAKGECATTLTPHKGKVQSVAWSLTEATVLLSGSYDRTARVYDCRSANKSHCWPVDSDVEALAWNIAQPAQFAVALEDGKVVVCDARVPGKTLYTIQAHDTAACSLSFSRYVRDCLVTSGADKKVKLWDLANDTPTCVSSIKMKLGPVYAVGFSPDSPLVVAAGGGKGNVRVWDLAERPNVQERFSGRL